MSDSVFSILIVVVFLVVFFGVILWTSRRSQSILQHWAEANSYQIVASEHRLFRRGPFLWTTARGQTVYYVTVVDAAGQMHSGYVRCGSFLGGLLSDKAEVRWDEAADPLRPAGS